MDSLSLLIKQAWQVRQAHKPVMCFSAPGAKHYNNRYYANRAHSFVNVSVTGNVCACRCEHCQGLILQTMASAKTPDIFVNLVDRLSAQGCSGILVSGGALKNGQVPLMRHIEAIKHAKDKGLKVLVHTGLVDAETAFALKEAGVDQVLIDVIGERQTIEQVYHLQACPEDYLQAMQWCRQAGLSIAPHVVIGLHYGQILGELKALEMIKEVDPESLVLVVLTPLIGTAMARVEPPSLEKVAELIARARIMHPQTWLTLGCARPAGLYKRQAEIIAIDCGVNGIAYPDEAAVRYAADLGLETRFSEFCCSINICDDACIMPIN